VTVCNEGHRERREELLEVANAGAGAGELNVGPGITSRRPLGIGVDKIAVGDSKQVWSGCSSSGSSIS